VLLPDRPELLTDLPALLPDRPLVLRPDQLQEQPRDLRQALPRRLRSQERPVSLQPASPLMVMQVSLLPAWQVPQVRPRRLYPLQAALRWQPQFHWKPKTTPRKRSS
jgi:hypothetical protein